MKKALITKLIGGLYTFVDLETKETFEGYARGKFRKVRVERDSLFNVSVSARTKKDIQDMTISPKVGDLINYEFQSDQYIITNILDRKNELNRPDISNIDQVLLIFSAMEPEFSFYLLDKFLIIVELEGLKPVIAVSKISLLNDKKLTKLKNELEYYRKYYDIYFIDSKDKTGIAEMNLIFKDKITVLAGQTGVGKSTFLNVLMPDLKLKTQEISKSLGRGKHTTRHLELYLYKGGYIADTPGFSKIEFKTNEFKIIKETYHDFIKVSHLCRFKGDCNHVNEPGCEVKRLVEINKIPKIRYENYISFIDEIKNKRIIY